MKTRVSRQPGALPASRSQPNAFPGGLESYGGCTDRSSLSGSLAPPIVHKVLNSPGEFLDTRTRGFFEKRFRQDFSRVRIHADPRAGESARAVQARAYTVGNHVVFGPGNFSPRTREGT